MAEDTSSAVIAQVLALFTGILGTGIFYAVSNDKSPFVRHHAAEALNFSITVTGAYLITCLLYTSDAADERSSVDLGGRRIIKKKKNTTIVMHRT